MAAVGPAAVTNAALPAGPGLDGTTSTAGQGKTACMDGKARKAMKVKKGKKVKVAKLCGPDVAANAAALPHV